MNGLFQRAPIVPLEMQLLAKRPLSGSVHFVSAKWREVGDGGPRVLPRFKTDAVVLPSTKPRTVVLPRTKPRTVVLPKSKTQQVGAPAVRPYE
jgi:hypothetical protein